MITMEQALAGIRRSHGGVHRRAFCRQRSPRRDRCHHVGRGEKLLAKVGESRVRLVSAIMLLVAALTALISVNGAVAALVPMVVVLAVRPR